MNLSDLTYSSLKTGIDALDVYFGTMKGNSSRKGYWISGYLNDSAWTWSTVSLEKTIH